VRLFVRRLPARAVCWLGAELKGVLLAIRLFNFAVGKSERWQLDSLHSVCSAQLDSRRLRQAGALHDRAKTANRVGTEDPGSRVGRAHRVVFDLVDPLAAARGGTARKIMHAWASGAAPNVGGLSLHARHRPAGGASIDRRRRP